MVFRSNFHQKKESAFSLIEMLVALAVFVVVVSVTVGIFASVLKAQRKSYNLQLTQDTARYIIEMIAKEVRMSKIESVIVPLKKMTITRLDNNEQVTYQFYDDSSAKIKRDDEAAPPKNLNEPSQVEIRGLFYSSDNKYVTIVLEAKSANTKPAEQAVVKLQTTLASRYYGP